MTNQKPIDIVHNAQNPIKTSTKIPVIGVRRNMSAMVSKDHKKTRQAQLDATKPEVLIQANDFHEYGDSMPLNNTEIVKPTNFSQRHASEFVYSGNTQL